MNDIVSAKPLTREQVAAVEAEIDRQHIVRHLVRVAVNNTKTADDYSALITREHYKMQRYDQNNGIARKIGAAILMLWACIWLGLCSLSEYLTREV